VLMGFIRKIILFAAFVALAYGGYLLFVSTEAPNFFLFGDLKNNAILLFAIGGILILLWIVSGLAKKISL